MELKAAVEVIHELMPEYHLAPGKETGFVPYPVRGIEELHLIVGP
jgi:hypothetical protein